MRKVGLWNFHQLEGFGGDTEASLDTIGHSTQAAGPASVCSEDVPGDSSATATPTSTPCRMKLRSQDSTRSDQASLTSIGQVEKCFLSPSLF